MVPFNSNQAIIQSKLANGRRQLSDYLNRDLGFTQQSQAKPLAATQVPNINIQSALVPSYAAANIGFNNAASQAIKIPDATKANAYVYDPKLPPGEDLNNYMIANPGMSQVDATTAYKAQMDIRNSGDFDTGQLFDTIGAGVGIATDIGSYFNDKKLRDKQIEGLDTNIFNAKQARTDRTNFIGGTQSAFA